MADPNQGAFPAPGIQFHTPEWTHFTRLLEQRRALLRDEYENPRMSPDDRLMSLGKLLLIKDLLAMPELQRRTSLAQEAWKAD